MYQFILATRSSITFSGLRFPEGALENAFFSARRGGALGVNVLENDEVLGSSHRGEAARWQIRESAFAEGSDCRHAVELCHSGGQGIPPCSASCEVMSRRERQFPQAIVAGNVVAVLRGFSDEKGAVQALPHQKESTCPVYAKQRGGFHDFQLTGKMVVEK